ncbi:FHA domain-containing protein [Thiohalophilus sp.]|uniref:FHA domain-containing protein n=1 Tax=Thiohalophilus sp. TaxID=3028392 RepID=UPI0039762E32
MSKLTLSFKGSILRVYPILKGSMLIGRDPQCTIHIDSLAVSPRHARLDTRDQTSVLVDLDSEGGTFVEQNKIDKHLLKDGDTIRIGKHTLEYKYEEDHNMAHVDELPVPEVEEITPQQADAEQTHETRQGWLQILNGQNLGKTLSLNRSMTNLGKPGVATAVITRRNDGYFLSHLEGEHPPLVDNQPLGDHSHKLQDGNTIQIGNIKMQFYLD